MAIGGQQRAPNALQDIISMCGYCHGLFTPRRRWAAFCSAKCRNGYEADVGAVGRVASVRRIRRGASVVIHLEGQAAERALQLVLRELVRLVRKPSVEKPRDAVGSSEVREPRGFAMVPEGAVQRPADGAERDHLP